MTRARAYWSCQAFGWGSYFLTTIYQFLRHDNWDPKRTVVEPLLSAMMGLALTHALRAFARKRNWASLDARALAPRIAVASIGLSFLHIAWLTFLEFGIYHDDRTTMTYVVVSAFIRWTFVFLVWLVLYFGYALIEQRRNSEMNRLQLERALKEAELGALRSQLNPHFLFNSLNGIRALVADDPPRAQEAITQISRILRYTLGARDGETVTLERELEIVDDYLALEALRLDTRLRVERKIEGETATFRIPRMLLQTLVENAIKHGISELPEGGVLGIEASVAEGALSIVIANPRPTATPKRPANGDSGVGLVNATERLRLLFGGGASLAVDLSRPGHATARVTIPPLPSP